jgi:hypothetical protein
VRAKCGDRSRKVAAVSWRDVTVMVCVVKTMAVSSRCNSGSDGEVVAAQRQTVST